MNAGTVAALAPGGNRGNPWSQAGRAEGVMEIPVPPEGGEYLVPAESGEAAPEISLTTDSLPRGTTTGRSSSTGSPAVSFMGGRAARNPPPPRQSRLSAKVHSTAIESNAGQPNTGMGTVHVSKAEEVSSAKGSQSFSVLEESQHVVEAQPHSLPQQQQQPQQPRATPANYRLLYASPATSGASGLPRGLQSLLQHRGRGVAVQGRRPLPQFRRDRSSGGFSFQQQGQRKEAKGTIGLHVEDMGEGTEIGVHASTAAEPQVATIEPVVQQPGSTEAQTFMVVAQSPPLEYAYHQRPLEIHLKTLPAQTPKPVKLRVQRLPPASVSQWVPAPEPLLMRIVRDPAPPVEPQRVQIAVDRPPALTAVPAQRVLLHIPQNFHMAEEAEGEGEPLHLHLSAPLDAPPVPSVTVSRTTSSSSSDDREVHLHIQSQRDGEEPTTFHVIGTSDLQQAQRAVPQQQQEVTLASSVPSRASEGNLVERQFETLRQPALAQKGEQQSLYIQPVDSRLQAQPSFLQTSEEGKVRTNWEEKRRKDEEKLKGQTFTDKGEGAGRRGKEGFAKHVQSFWLSV
uniref:Uncharacterized protein n=1 Tax=Chromera velia CCMP2878 TaxID=1169474 RepID=A0A0G4G741_9ALVE|eukprot:Cvel_20590.t1-p1 / transcript=Cvel_20590.t1 / gene=Cvel_20590 / organism=Chromera_velia_CCMP2878 / gene_product=hypothetical protein / transcript_product=hypothetical protein / location=Cvel_scaffold1861:8370-15531(-) / protein_length=566 / sequence_SO=supercontig / SO=protein_coding / is_pseudo=false